MSISVKRFLLSFLCMPFVSGSFKALNRDKLRVIFYHRIAKDGTTAAMANSGMFVEESRFDLQMDFIKEHYSPVSEVDVVAAAKGKLKLPPNAVWVTFDDGYKDNFTLARPILKKYGIPATFFVTTGYINGDSFPAELLESSSSGISDKASLFMTWEDLKELSAEGFAIGSHTMIHPRCSQLLLEDFFREVSVSRQEIERKVGMAVRSFAYPYGDFKEALTGAPLTDAGFEVAVTVEPGLNLLPAASRFKLKRLCLGAECSRCLLQIKLASGLSWKALEFNPLKCRLFQAGRHLR